MRKSYLEVNVDTVQIVFLDPGSHSVGCSDGVSAGRGRSVSRAEGGHDELDARSRVLGLDARALSGSEASPLLSLVPRSLDQQEREREDVETLQKSPVSHR